MKKIILAVLLASSVPAMAQSAYVGGSVGRSEQKLTLDALSPVDAGTGAKVYGGYQMSKNFGVELGYADLGKATQSGGLVITTKPKTLFAAATGTLPISKEVSAFGKIGVARTKTKIAASFGGLTQNSTDKETSLMLGVGASYAINDQLLVLVEYENFGKISKVDNGDNLKADLVSVGLRFKF
jgi:OOP family OmpA-OmpF porin